MTRQITIACFILAGTIGVPAQSGFIVHLDSHQYGWDGQGASVFSVPSGYLVFSELEFNVWGHDHIFVLKLDGLGQVVHQRVYAQGDSRNYYMGAHSPVCRIDTGGFASMVAVIPDTPCYCTRSWFYRFDQEGDTVSSKPLFTYDPEDSVGHQLQQTRQTADGGYIAVGSWGAPFLNDHGHALLVRLNAQGDTLWTRTYGPSSQSSMAHTCAEYVDGGFLLAGYRLQGFVNNDQFLIRTDSVGNKIWRVHFGADAGGVYAVRVAPDSTIITAGAYRQQQWPNHWQQAMFTKRNASGGILWQKKSHYNYLTSPNDMEVLPDGSFVSCIRVGPYVTHIAKFSSSGDSLWSRGYTVFIDGHYPNAISLTPDGGFITTGMVYQGLTDPHPNLNTIYVIKTDSLGCVVPGCQNVGVGEYEISLQERLRIWPMPAMDHVRLELDLPEGYALSGAVRAVVLDASGREVLQENVTINGRLLANTLSLGTVSPGLYYLHLADEKRWLAGGKVVVE